MNALSAFDPSLFLDATISEPTIRRPPLNIGDYNSVIQDVKIRPWQSKDGTKSGLALDVVHEVEVPADQQSKIGQPKVRLTHGGFLDVTPDGKGLDNSPGKNRAVRQYRDATNLNKPGDSFNFRMLIGRPVKVKIAHEVYEGDVLDKVDGVATL